jgi:hypothetical protein
VALKPAVVLVDFLLNWRKTNPESGQTRGNATAVGLA